MATISFHPRMDIWSSAHSLSKGMFICIQHQNCCTSFGFISRYNLHIWDGVQCLSIDEYVGYSQRILYPSCVYALRDLCSWIVPFHTSWVTSMVFCCADSFPHFVKWVSANILKSIEYFLWGFSSFHKGFCFLCLACWKTTSQFVHL